MKKLSRPFAFALVFAAGMFAGGALTGTVHAEPQPAMQAALGGLNAALDALQRADNDKGGHRVKAIEHTKKAIEQVEKGIKFDNKH